MPLPGGYRTVAPEMTWERVRRHVSPLTGIVGELTSAPLGTRSAAHVAVAGQNVAREGARTVRARCAGKGTTEIEARVGAVCEALERASGLFHGSESRRRATLHELGAAALAPESITLFSAAQIAARDEWNRAQGDVNFVPRPLDPDLEIDWSPVVLLQGGDVRYAASHLCWYGHPEARMYELPRADSSGCAAGNTREEAIVQGFLELVERDAVAAWWYPRCRRPAVAIESFARPELTAMCDALAALGHRVRVLDLTHDLGIAVFAAVSSPGHGRRREAILGFGAHFDPAIALTRALTELHQFLPRATRPGPRPRSAWLFDEERLDPAVLEPDEAQPVRERRDFRLRTPETLDEAVSECVTRAARAGLEAFVLDQGRPGMGLAVVRVIVPGLRPMWARFAPGRLYDVPVRLGWRAAPPAETSLHASHLYL